MYRVGGMNVRKLNKKGFTLIELLAVIVILGVLLLIAIPSMNAIIEGSKKDAYVSTGKSYIQTVRFQAIQGDYELPSPGGYTVVATDLVELESGSKRSPYDQDMKNEFTYVLIVNAGTSLKDDYQYYYQSVDNRGNGTNGQIAENSLDRDSIVKGTAQSSAISINTLSGDTYELSIGGKQYTKVAVYPAS